MSKELIPNGLTYLAGNILTKDNLLGVSKSSRAKWAEGLNLPKQLENIFFAGCGYQFNDEFEKLGSLIHKIDKSGVGTENAMRLAGLQKKIGIDGAAIFRKFTSKNGQESSKTLLDAVHVLDKLGVKFGYLGEEEPCCGGLLHYMGLRGDFEKHGLALVNKLRSKGIRQITGIVPSCTYTLRTLIFEKLNVRDIEVKQFCQVVAERISSVELRFPRQVKVTYHDPCQMVRYFKLTEEPRQIIQSIKGIEFVEPAWTKKEWATCCGGGGGFEVVFPEMSRILAAKRAQELVDTGAEIIVTHCPGCILQLKAGLNELKINNVEVLDLAQILAMSMGV